MNHCVFNWIANLRSKGKVRRHIASFPTPIVNLSIGAGQKIGLPHTPNGVYI
jgi:hypothetical protein